MKQKKVGIAALCTILAFGLVACSNKNDKLINQPVFERYGIDSNTGKRLEGNEEQEQQSDVEESVRDKSGKRVVKETPEEVFTYEIEDGKAIITGLNEFHFKEIKIPATVEGYSVVGIAGSIFKSCANLEYVELPDNMTYIGDKVFDYTEKLQEVVIPDSVVTIGESAFSNCSSLVQIGLPKNLETIGESVFSNCELLSSIVIPETVTKIGESAFSNCSNLKTIQLNKGITEIGQRAFQKCISLKEIILPEGLKAINIATFYGCSSLELIQIPASVENIYPTAFTGCNLEQMTVVVSNGSDAHQYAKDNDMIVRVE